MCVWRRGGAACIIISIDRHEKKTVDTQSHTLIYMHTYTHTQLAIMAEIEIEDTAFDTFADTSADIKLFGKWCVCVCVCVCILLLGWGCGQCMHA